MSIDIGELEKILASLLYASEKGLTVSQIQQIIEQVSHTQVEAKEIETALDNLSKSFANCALVLHRGASGYRLQTHQQYSQWITALKNERPPKYSRALLETIALIAYRQPITRGEIEYIRGVSTGNNIIRTLRERNWIRVLGHKEVPGKPEMLGTTREFLDHLNIEKLSQLPPLPELSADTQDELPPDAPEQSND